MSSDLDGAVVVCGPIAGPGGTEHGLHVFAETRPECLAVRAEDEGGESADLLRDEHCLHIEFVSQQVGERLQRGGITAGIGDRRQRKTNQQALVFTKTEPGRGHISEPVHCGDQRIVSTVGRSVRPFGQVD